MSIWRAGAQNRDRFCYKSNLKHLRSNMNVSTSINNINIISWIDHSLTALRPTRAPAADPAKPPWPRLQAGQSVGLYLNCRCKICHRFSVIPPHGQPFLHLRHENSLSPGPLPVQAAEYQIWGLLCWCPVPDLLPPAPGVLIAQHIRTNTAEQANRLGVGKGERIRSRYTCTSPPSTGTAWQQGHGHLARPAAAQEPTFQHFGPVADWPHKAAGASRQEHFSN